MKKIFLLIALFAIVVPAFARDDWSGNRRMAVTVHTTLWGPAGIGFGFEYALAPNVSIKIRVLYGLGRGTGNAFLGFNLDGRWYPRGNYVQGWFLSGGLQFLLSFADPSIRGEDRASNALSAFVGTGYKLILGSDEVRPAFVYEMAAEAGWRIIHDGADPMTSWLLGMSGPRFRFPIGVAF